MPVTRWSGRYVVMGVCSTGKSRIGAALAEALGAGFVDGDDLHPESNVAKMARGAPLDDADRAPWLDRVGDVLQARPSPVIIACSALKRSYRDRIRAKCPAAAFLHLTGERSLIEARMKARSGHFMPLSLLDSQLATLEPLETDEAGAAFDIDAAPDAIVQRMVVDVSGGA